MKDASKFDSIPHTMWYVSMTMTGHGHITPYVQPLFDAFGTPSLSIVDTQTFLLLRAHKPLGRDSTPGKMLAILCMLFAVVFLAMPLAIVGTHFSEIWFVSCAPLASSQPAELLSTADMVHKRSCLLQG